MYGKSDFGIESNRNATQADAAGAVPCRGCPVRFSGICTALRDTDKASQIGLGRSVALEAGSVLWDGESRATHVWMVRSGVLRLQRFGMDGRRQILCMSMPGDIIGDEMTSREGYTIEASTDAVVCRFERREFDAMTARSSDLRRAMVQQRLAKLERLRWLTWSLGALRPDERFCGFLAMATGFMPFRPSEDGGGVLSIQIPRADIADLLGTTVESISRISHKLQAAGVLKIISPSQFHLPDLEELIRLGSLETTFESFRCDSSEIRGSAARSACPDARRPQIAAR